MRLLKLLVLHFEELDLLNFLLQVKDLLFHLGYHRCLVLRLGFD